MIIADSDPRDHAADHVVRSGNRLRSRLRRCRGRRTAHRSAGGRGTSLPPGASWIAEYGDPDDPEQWTFIRRFSPYHNVKADEAYPPVLVYTARSDDRVGPAQARKMAAKMQAQGHPGVWFYENTEGGDGAAADNRQSAAMWALIYGFLLDRLH